VGLKTSALQLLDALQLLEMSSVEFLLLHAYVVTQAETRCTLS
jgi:hypothetical protein